MHGVKNMVEHFILKAKLHWQRADGLIVGLFAILVILFYWRILTPNLHDRQSFPPGDFSQQFWTFSTFEVRELSAGRLPLWNPYTFAGAPFWADVQSAVFYPPSLLTLLLSAPWGFSVFALEIEAIAHVWLAAVFMYLLVRELTSDRSAAFISTLTFTFSGYLTGYPSQQLAVLEADVWLPLILYFLTKATDRQDTCPTHLLFASIAWSMTLLAGHPQSALMVGYLSTTYLIFRLITHQSKIENRKFFYVASYLLIGLALSAIQFIPAVEYTMLSVRAAGTYEKMSGGFPLIDLVQLLLPGLVSHYSPLYIGLVGLILAMAGVRSKEYEVKTLLLTPYFFATTAFICFLISFGGNTFLYSPLYLTMPGFSIFRGQERWAFGVAFSLSVLAGYGFQNLKSYRLENAFILRLTQYLLYFILLLGGLSFYGLNDTGWKADNPFYGLLNVTTFGALLLTLSWLLWRYGTQLSPRWLTILTAFLICLDLFTTNWRTNLYPQLPEWHSQQPAIVQAIKQDGGLNPPPFRIYNEFRLYDNYGVPFEMEDLWGASPLRPSRYDEFIAPPMPKERVWELLNVKYVITWQRDLAISSTVIYQEAAADGTTYVHRLHNVGARAWLVQQAEVADKATMLKKLADPQFDRWHIALFETEIKPLSPKTTPHQTAITRTMNSPTHLTYQVTTPTSAWLILSETYYPGWQAVVDGQPAPILPADAVLRAIPVAAGEHTVEMSFRPLSFTIGAIISALAVMILAIALLRKSYQKSFRASV